MKKLLLSLLGTVLLSSGFLQGELLPQSSLTAIEILRSARCPKTPVWVKATIQEALDTDTYMIEDSSGSILLFLPTEELEATPLQVGNNVLIYGKVDISPVRPEKNELYAEKIILVEG